jgi:CheY-like chemotaxis protein
VIDLPKILVVDDERGIRLYLRVVFEDEGYDVVEANDGAAALEIVLDERPDLVVTDLMMPLLDGNELIVCLRSDPSTAEIPILSLTSTPEASVGADAVCIKLPPVQEFLTTVLSLLAS